MRVILSLSVLIALSPLIGCLQSADSRDPGPPTSAEDVRPPMLNISTPGKPPRADMGPDSGYNNGDMGGCGAPADDLSPYVPCLPYCDELAQDPPSLLLLLDRSGSMLIDDKWQLALQAIYDTAYSLNDEALLGLAIFPARGDTCSGELLLEPALKQGPDLEVVTSQLFPDGNTPMAGALVETLRSKWYLTYRDTDTSPRTKAVIIITDGKATACNGGDANEEVLEHVRALARRGVRTYAVGFGYQDDAAQLDRIAFFGGTEEHFLASDSKGLVDAMKEIKQDARRCIPR